MSPIIGVGVILLGIPLALLLLRDWLKKPSRKELDEYSRKFVERLKNPDFGAVEKHFERPLPASVLALYRNPEELMRGDFEVWASREARREERWYVGFYQPADAEAVKDMPESLERFFAFADDGCGNAYLIDPKQEDPVVLFHDHETDEISRVCGCFSEFMRWPRVPPGKSPA